MGVFRMVLAEISGRPLNFVLSLVGVVIAAALFVAGHSLLAGYSADTRFQLANVQQETDKMLAEMDKKTRRIMRDLGVNLRIVHEKTNMDNLYANFEAHDFSEDYVQKLANAPQIESIVHLLALLQERIVWNDRPVFLTGVMPVMTTSQKNEEKPHMIKDVQRGTVTLGHFLGSGRQVGETIEIQGKKFTIAAIERELGTQADVQFLVHLHDAQELLGKQGKINQIMALNCKCKGDRISVIRKELEGVLPDTKVTENEPRASAREAQRDLVAQSRKQEMERLKQERDRQESSLAAATTYVIPCVVLVSALFVGLQTWINVRERRGEIGLLRALGKTTQDIAALFLLKSALVGLAGGVLGCLAGGVLAQAIGSRALQIPPQFQRLDIWLMAGTALGAPLVASMASYLPMLSAVMQDPAVVLMDR